MEAIGRYRIERRLGAGAFATVWLCRDTVLDAPVAIKVLAENWAHHLDVHARFTEEARILRRADSERIVRVLDIGELPDGRPYFVMPYADRGTLADRLEAGELPVGEALGLAVEIARGVAVLHEVKVIHRDLKPSNVLFQSRPEGGERLLIADLGLAKSVAHASGFTVAAGSPGYMSPEQSRVGGDLDVRADVYALGALTYHLLTGAQPPPWPVRVAPTELRAGLPDGTDEALLRALAPDRERRWPSADAFRAALEALSAADPVPPAVPDAGDTSGAVASGDAPGHTGDGAAGPAVVPGPAGPAELVPVAGPDAAERAGANGTVKAPRGERRRRRRPRRWISVVAVAAAALAAGGAAVAGDRLPWLRVRVTDSTGQLSLTVPARWAGQLRDDGWSPRAVGLADDRGAALAVAGDLDDWARPGTTTPGVFAGLTSDVRDGAVPPASVTHPGCTAGQPQTYERDGFRVHVVRWDRCPDPVSFSEAGLYDAGGRFAVYVQVKQRTGGDDQARAVIDSVEVNHR
jgi:eukaryotic-like serine/threonine-protein kinase